MPQNTTTTAARFDSEGAIFMAARRDPTGCNVGLFGVPYDGTSSFRPGSRFGPAAIRDVSNGLETYCPQLDLDLEDLAFTDLGALDIPCGDPKPVVEAVKKATQNVLQMGLRPLMLGGEHSISSGAVAAITEFHSDLVLLQLHACAMRRCLEVLPSAQLLQFAIRSGTRAEFQELHDQQRLVNHNTGQAATELATALAPHQGKPLYLTVDLDWFDPSVLPGTGTPEPGGFLWRDFAAVVDVLRQHQLVGADVVELAPQLDPSGMSSVLAAKVTRSLLMLLSLSATSEQK